MTVTHIKKKLSAKGRRYLESRAPQLIENDKQMLFIRSHTAANFVNEILQQLASLRRPLARHLNRRRHVQLFEDASPVERLCVKMDASLFAVASHTRKRPNALTLGRMFDGQLLDLIELCVLQWKSMAEFGTWRPAAAHKPLLQFVGERWTRTAAEQKQDAQNNSDEGQTAKRDIMPRLRSLLIDIFGGGRSVEAVRLAGIETVMVFVAPENSDEVLLRTYRVLVAPPSSTDNADNPTAESNRISLRECGPHAVLSPRRHQLASDDLFRRALRQPKQQKMMKNSSGQGGKRVKNVSDGQLGSQMGRIHMVKQDMHKLATRKLKAFKKSAQPSSGS